MVRELMKKDYCCNSFEKRDDSVRNSKGCFYLCRGLELTAVSSSSHVLGLDTYFSECAEFSDPLGKSIHTLSCFCENYSSG